MNIDDIIKTFEFLGHSPLEITIIAPPQFKGDTNAGVKACAMVDAQDKFASICSKWDGDGGNIYVGLNELKSTYKTGKGHRAQKSDIEAVHFTPIDIDVVKPDDMKYQASTDEELQTALETGKALAEWFEQKGFIKPAMAMSGNGCQLWCRIPRYDLTSEPKQGNEFKWELRLKLFYDEVRAAIPQHLSAKVKIDSIQDVTRIFKIIGTTSVKGDSSKHPNRPHRESYWITEPIGTEDTALRDYILSLPIKQPKKVAVKATQATTKVTIGLPKITNEQKRILETALKHPYVRMVREKVNQSDLSISGKIKQTYQKFHRIF